VKEKYFTIYLGASRVKFALTFEDGKYKAKVNDIVIAEGTDYEAVRSNLLVGMHLEPDLSQLH
jgi:hypothetical protein